MKLFALANWPLLFICAAMIVAAVIDCWKLKVPNLLTLPLIVSGWFLGLAFDLGWLSPPHSPQTVYTLGHFFGALAGTGLGFVLLGWFWLLKAMGAGDVKMQMGFGSWVGAVYGPNEGLWIFVYGFCVGVIIGGIIGLIMMVTRGNIRQSLQNAREFATDVVKGGSDFEEKAKERKARQQLLPYGVPLCLGFVGYLVYYVQYVG